MHCGAAIIMTLFKRAGWEMAEERKWNWLRWSRYLTRNLNWTISFLRFISRKLQTVSTFAAQNIALDGEWVGGERKYLSVIQWEAAETAVINKNSCFPCHKRNNNLLPLWTARSRPARWLLSRSVSLICCSVWLRVHNLIGESMFSIRRQDGNELLLFFEGCSRLSSHSMYRLLRSHRSQSSWSLVISLVMIRTKLGWKLWHYQQSMAA